MIERQKFKQVGWGKRRCTVKHWEKIGEGGQRGALGTIYVKKGGEREIT